MIPSVIVSADNNPSFTTDPGNSTTDRVFLLSLSEANKYFSSDTRKCAPTAYAIAQGAWTSDYIKVDGKAACVWWLRSPGIYSYYAARAEGSSHNGRGGSVDGVGVAVRPALWIDLSKAD